LVHFYDIITAENVGAGIPLNTYLKMFDLKKIERKSFAVLILVHGNHIYRVNCSEREQVNLEFS
jgi:hypothetical protein